MDWKVVDERLIRCGELLLSLDFLDCYGDGLEAMNRKKVGILIGLRTVMLSSWLLFVTFSVFLTGGLRDSLRAYPGDAGLKAGLSHYLYSKVVTRASSRAVKIGSY